MAGDTARTGALLGGLITLGSSYRHMAMFGAWLAAISGAWFVLGTALRPLWNGPGSAGPSAGTAVGSQMMRMWEQVGFFTGLGVLVVLLAAMALGRFTVIGAREAGRIRRPRPLAAGGSASVARRQRKRTSAKPSGSPPPSKANPGAPDCPAPASGPGAPPSPNCGAPGAGAVQSAQRET